MRKEGENLIIGARSPKSLPALLATPAAPLEEDFPPIADLPPNAIGL